MDGEENIDKLFKERLQQDNPAFKEEYWQGFEKMLEAVPPSPPSVPSSGITGLGKIFSSLTLTKGIFRGIGIAILSAAIYYAVDQGSEERALPDAEISKTEVIAEKAQKEPSTPLKQVHGNYTGSGTEAAKAETPVGNISSQDVTRTGITDAPKTADFAGSNVIPDHIPDSHESLGMQESSDHPTENDSKQVMDLGGEAGGMAVESLQHIVDEEKQPEMNDEVFAETGVDTVTSNEAYYADSVYQAVASTAEGYGKAGSSAGSQKYRDSKFKMFVLPGMALYNTFGNQEDFKTALKPAFSFGAGFSYNVTKSFSLYSELNFQMVTGFKLTESSLNTEYLFYQWVNKVSIENRNFTLMDVPVMVQYQVNRHTYGAGPVFRYVMSSGGEKVVMDTTPLMLSYYNTTAENYLSGINRFQAGVSLEYSWNFYRQHAVLVRYNLMAGDFTRSSYYEGFTSRRLNQLFIAFRFRIY